MHTAYILGGLLAASLYYLFKRKIIMSDTKPTSGQVSHGGSTVELKLNALTTAIEEVEISGGEVPIIAILGDSLAEVSSARTDAWPQIMESILRQSGDNVRVVSLAHSGATFYSAQTQTTYGGTTMLDKAIALAPAVVIVQLGYNDILSGRTEVEVKADALAIAVALRTALPDAKLVFSAELVYDNVCFPSITSLKSKGTLPFDFTFPASGLSSGAYSAALLETAASTATKNKLSSLSRVNAYVSGLSQWDGAFDNDYWRIARLGCMLIDGLHPTLAGMQFLAHNVLTGLANINTVTEIERFRAIAPTVLGAYSGIFSALLTKSGDGWIDVAPNPEVDKVAYEMSLTRKINPRSWFYPYRTRFSVHNPSVANAPTYLVIENGPPLAAVFASFAGAAFSSSVNTTSADGFALITLPAAYGGGDNLIKVGNEVYGPFTIVASATVEQTFDGNLILGQATAAGTRRVDFRSSNMGAYDVRLASTGGSGSGNGTLTVTAGNVVISGTSNLAGTLACAAINATGPISTNGALSSTVSIASPAVSATNVTATNTVAANRVTINGLVISTQTTGIGTWFDMAGVCGIIPGTGVAPNVDAVSTLGHANYRWSSVWAVTGVVSTSDATAKKHIKGSKLGLDFVNSLRPVSYKWRNGKDKGTYHGFIAQEVHEALGGRAFAGLTVPSADTDLYGLRYSEFIAPLTKAVQELTEQNRALCARLTKLENQ